MTTTTNHRQTLQLRITARSPLAFAERKPGAQFRDSLPYIPGATLFGALGRNLAEHGQYDVDLMRSVRCHNAYPMEPGDRWVRPLPLTALQTKGKDKAPIADGLVERICWERQQPAAAIYLPSDDTGRPWEFPSLRFYTLQDKCIHKRQVSQRVLTRVAINRQRGTAEDQRLYSPLVLTEATFDPKTREVNGSLFSGSVSTNQAEIVRVTQLLPAIRFVGGRQSTGLGAVSVEADEGTERTDEPNLCDRITRVTKRFQEEAALYHALGGSIWQIADRSIFTVNLLSDAILFEHGWIPTQIFSATELHALTGIRATLLRSFTRTLSVGGWATIWQQHKAANLAVGMGSLYVFQADQTLTENNCQKLEQLQLDGIGERCQEGFGQVRICDDFHLEPLHHFCKKDAKKARPE